MHPLDHIMKIKHAIVFSPLGRPLLKIDASDNEKKIFFKYNFIAEISMKMHFFYPDNKLECIMLKNKKYTYYIPSDVYKYLKYDGKSVSMKNETPDELKEKVSKCAKCLELELNYLKYIIGVNFEKNNFITFQKRNKFFKPTIIIDHSTEKLSFNYTYEKMIDNDYIKNYDELLEEEEQMIKSGKYII